VANNPTYAEMIAQMKLEAAARQQQQLVREATALYQDVQETERAAAEALQQGDTETANYYVQELTEKEQELGSMVERLPQPAPPPPDPRLAQFEARNQAYLGKLRAKVGPQRAGQFLNWCDQRLVKMGIARNSPDYFRRGRDMLELDSERCTGVPYNSGDQALTANQAAKISGLAPDEYNRASREMAAQGRFSWQQKR
jgi:hypothetical protein